MSVRNKNLLNVLASLLIVALLAGALPAAPAAARSHQQPKNIIVMISDGMGYNQSLAASYYLFGKPDRPVYYRFPFRSAMSTYPGAESLGAPDGDPCAGWGYDPARAWSEFDYVRICPTDSAAAATAMATGVKTYNAAIGVDVNGERVKNVVEAAEAQGKATGVVTTVEFSHATPAGFVAHNLSRNDYAGIAQEMIYQSAVDVIMGAGHPWFDNDGLPKTTPNTFKYVGDESAWNDLIAGSAGNDADGDGDFDAWTLVQTRQDFQNLAFGATPARVVGVAQVYTTLQQSRSGDGMAAPYQVPLNASVPNLAEMTLAALNVLDEDPDGLFLMVEGGAVDWASHANQPGRTIEEQVDFNLAVEAVVRWVQAKSNWGETLLIVTADHETGYLWGPGSNPTWEPLVNNGRLVQPGMQFNSSDHTNSLIPFFAKGADARWFKPLADQVDPVRGAYLDNTAIAQVIFQLLGEQ